MQKYWKNLTPCGQMSIFSSWILFGMLGVLSTNAFLKLYESRDITIGETMFGVLVISAMLIITQYIFYSLIKRLENKVGCGVDSCRGW